MHGKNKTKWALRLYPNGNEEKTSNWFGICLVKQAEASPNYAYSCRFSIIKGGKVILTKEFPATATPNMKVGKEYGFIQFLSHRNLFQRFDNYVGQNQLEIRAEIELSSDKKNYDYGNSSKILSEVYLRSSL